MAKEKSQTFVETNKAVAAGLASVVVALFTSKLGVAGTLIGTALTATLITLISAVLKAQMEKASQVIVSLPSTVQGDLSTQQIRIPGKQGPEPHPKPEAGERSPGLWSRLRALPGFLRDLPPAQRSKVLLAGVLAGLVATVIGLVSVTGIEFAGGKTLSCMVWSCDESAEATGRSGPSLSILGGSSYTETSIDPSEEQQRVPIENQQAPQEQPARPGVNGGTPQQPEETPQVKDQVQPGEGGKEKQEEPAR